MTRLTLLNLIIVTFVLPPLATSAQVTFPAVTSLNAPDTPYELAKGDFNNDGKPDLIAANFTDDANQQFTLVLSNNSGSFTGSNFRNVGASTYMIDVAVGDFNEDGNLDAVGCSPQNNNFSLVLGNGSGNFAAATNFNTGDQPRGIAVGDLNKDNNLDVIISHIGTPNDVYIFFGNGAGGFSAPTTMAMAINTGYDITVADFDGDTNPDFAIVVASMSSSTVQIWNGDGQLAPTFTLGTSITSFANATEIDARDLDNDGDMDILGDPGYSLNDGTGTFQPRVSLHESKHEFAAGDLNSDGHPDIAAVDFSGSIHPNVNIFAGDGTGVFTQVARFEIQCGIWGMEITDMNHDGNPDVIVAGSLGGQGKVEILLGDGTGYFSNSVFKYPTTTDPRDLVKGDFNEDGLIDVAFCHSTGSNNISVYLGVGQGRFSKSTTNYTAGLFPFQIITMDYNKDNHLDLVTFNLNSSSSVTILTGAGNGLFTALPNIPVATATFGRITSADFNNDTNPDLAVTGGITKMIYVLTGTGTGFNSPASFAVTQEAFDIKAADFNADNNQDLAVTFQNTNQVALLTGNGSGSFTEGTKYPIAADFLRIDDLNNDGKPDINVFDVSSSGSDFYINDGAGVFTGSSIAVSLGGNAFGWADMNGDGFKDLILGTQFSNSSQPGTINIYRGTATGPSASSLISKSFSGGNTLVTHDVNGDGKEDIIATSFYIYGDSFSVLLNTTSTATCVSPSVSSLSPDAAVCQGEPVTISVTAAGTGPFSYQWKRNTVNIAGATSAAYAIVSVTSANAGAYTVEITNACGTITSNASNLAVTPVTPPTVTHGSRCDDGAVTLTAFGAVNGNYRWYDTEFGGAPISGQVNNTFTTGSLSNTTSYYVSIVSGICESTRTVVTATIGEAACNNQPPVINTTSLIVSLEGSTTLDLLPLISDADDNLDVSSLRITIPPASGAIASITDGILTINYEGISFSGNETLTIEVCDLLGSCIQQQFTIEVADDTIVVYNGISPNGDLLNATWQIQNIELNPETQQNKVTIYNRWGDEVFSIMNYDNATRVFKGVSKGGSDLPSGTYFYKIEFANHPSKLGYLVLKR
jgi:gliding motility-associated-like protein